MKLPIHLGHTNNPTSEREKLLVSSNSPADSPVNLKMTQHWNESLVAAVVRMQLGASVTDSR